MGSFQLERWGAAKGPIPHWLDQLSLAPDALARLNALLEALKNNRPRHQGLETVFDTYLAAPLGVDAAFRQRLRDYLAERWFGGGPSSYFPAQRVAEKYAEGVIKTLELSLQGKPNPIPIHAWWLIQPDPEVRMLNLAEVDRNGVTVSSSVTLLICTPMPHVTGAAPSTRALWGDAEAWITEQQQGAVVTRQIAKETQGGR
jgi:hypothetical protein